MEKNNEQHKRIFPQETINALVGLGEILRRIHNRMISEGYDIIDNKIIHVATGKTYDPKANKKRKYQRH